MTALLDLLPANPTDADDRMAKALLKMDDERRHEMLNRMQVEDPAKYHRTMAAWGYAKTLRWRASPAALAHHLDPTYQRWAYVELLSDRFRDAVLGIRPRQIWNLPARYGKSVAAQWGCVWCLDWSKGKARIIYVSYGHELAMANVVVVRDRLNMHSDELRGQLMADRRRKDRFSTVGGGGILGAGIDGAIVGFGAGDGGGIVLDDPFKNWQQAHSEARREHVYNQFKGTLRHRLDQEDAWIIVIHHRVHEDDLTARLLKDQLNGEGDTWDLLSLPALATELDDPLGRAIGEPLEPARFSREDVQARARALGSYLASGLEQQKPTSPEGKELLRKWFVLAEPSEMPRVPDDACTSWDLKMKDKEAGDYVVGQAWWRAGSAYWIMDQVRGQYDHATTANAIALLAVRNPHCHVHHVEAAGSYDEVLPMLRAPIQDYEVSSDMVARLGMTDAEAAAVQVLRRTGMANLLETGVVGDKRVRARSHIAGEAEAGHVRMPAEAPWVAELLDELSGFPDATYDDQVDAMSLALSKLRYTGGVTTSAAALLAAG